MTLDAHRVTPQLQFNAQSMPEVAEADMHAQQIMVSACTPYTSGKLSLRSLKYPDCQRYITAALQAPGRRREP